MHQGQIGAFGKIEHKMMQWLGPPVAAPCHPKAARCIEFIARHARPALPRGPSASGAHSSRARADANGIAPALDISGQIDLYLRRTCTLGALVALNDDFVSARKIHVRVSADLHRQLRIRCAELDLTIQDFVVSVLERELSPADQGLGSSTRDTNA